MDKKYELTDNFKITDDGMTKVYQIKALIDFRDVHTGDLGGYIESEKNLSQLHHAWVYDNAQVYGDAEVSGNAMVYDNAWVYGNAKVFDNAQVYGDAEIYEDAMIYGNAQVYGDAEVSGNAIIYDNTWVYGTAWIYDNAQVYGDAYICGGAHICGGAEVRGNANIQINAKICSNRDYATITGFGTNNRTITFFRCEDNVIKLTCGCFAGTISEFRDRVKRTRKGKIVDEYLRIADLMELHFSK